MARAVAEFLVSNKIDIYFDEEDVILQAAASEGDAKAVVKCIEDGVDKATHLLGIITRRTFKSWWVPYEIGIASGKKKKCGHLIASEVDCVPSYVEVADLLWDIVDLLGWIGKESEALRWVLWESKAGQEQPSLLKYLNSVRSNTTRNKL